MGQKEIAYKFIDQAKELLTEMPEEVQYQKL